MNILNLIHVLIPKIKKIKKIVHKFCFYLKVKTKRGKPNKRLNIT